MTSHRLSIRLTVTALALAAALVAAGPALAAGAPAAGLVADSAAAGCPSTAVDLTSPDVLELLASGRVQTVGTPEVRFVASGKGDATVTKVSEAPFVVVDDQGNLVGGGTLSCSGTCTGSWCGVNGCDPDNGDCSPCSCSGNCSSGCSCTKTSTSEQAPGPRTPETPSE